MMTSLFSALRRLAAPLVVAGFLALPMVLSAHPGHVHPGEEDEFATNAIAAGLEHPVTGVDHMLAALAVGWVCASLGRRSGLAGGAAFLVALLAGGLAGQAGLTMPGQEAALGISVLALGLLVVSGRKLAMPWLLAAVIAIGLVHGAAHGSEGPAGAAAARFAVGFLLATALLAATGAGLRLLATRWEPARKLAGGLLATAGAYFLVQAAS